MSSCRVAGRWLALFQTCQGGNRRAQGRDADAMAVVVAMFMIAVCFDRDMRRSTALFGG